MNAKLPVSFSDIIVLILIFLFLNETIEWSYWYLSGLFIWYRFHVIRKRAWHSIKTTAKNGEIARKIRKEQKSVVVIIAMLLLTSCSKEWKCTITSSYNGDVMGTAVVPFEGTRREMKAYEDDNSHKSQFFTQTVKCK